MNDRILSFIGTTSSGEPFLDTCQRFSIPTGDRLSVVLRSQESWLSIFLYLRRSLDPIESSSKEGSVHRSTLGRTCCATNVGMLWTRLLGQFSPNLMTRRLWRFAVYIQHLTIPYHETMSSYPLIIYLIKVTIDVDRLYKPWIYWRPFVLRVDEPHIPTSLVVIGSRNTHVSTVSDTQRLPYVSFPTVQSIISGQCFYRLYDFTTQH